MTNLCFRVSCIVNFGRSRLLQIATQESQECSLRSMMRLAPQLHLQFSSPRCQTNVSHVSPEEDGRSCHPDPTPRPPRRCLPAPLSRRPPATAASSGCLPFPAVSSNCHRLQVPTARPPSPSRRPAGRWPESPPAGRPPSAAATVADSSAPRPHRFCDCRLLTAASLSPSRRRLRLPGGPAAATSWQSLPRQ